MYRAVVTIAGIYGTFPEGAPVAGVDESILKSWLDDGIITFEPEFPAEVETVEVAPEPERATFEPVAHPVVEDTFEPNFVPFEPEFVPFAPEAAPIAFVPSAPVKAGKKSPRASATKA